MVAPFCLLEGKSHRGDTMEVEDQARRGGAALVNALRILYDLAGEPDVQGADQRTFVYAVAFETRFAQFFVHWAEVLPDITVFHMNLFYQKFLDERDSLEKIRCVFHNIFEWGLIQRWDQLQPIYQKVFASEPERIKQAYEQAQRETEAAKADKQAAMKLKKETLKKDEPESSKKRKTMAGSSP